MEGKEGQPARCRKGGQEGGSDCPSAYETPNQTVVKSPPSTTTTTITK